MAFGLLTTTRTTRSGYGSTVNVIRLRYRDHAVRFKQSIGFISARKSALLAVEDSGRQATVTVSTCTARCGKRSSRATLDRAAS